MTNLHKICLAILLLASFLLFFHNNDFPLGYHPDEVKKVDFIQNGTQDFYHPILLLQSVRGANGILRITDPQKIAELGRLISALAGVVMVGATFFLAKRLMPPAWALLASAMTAACPLIAVHAHYLKEDLLFTCFAMLTLLQLLRTLDAPKASQFVLLGILLGLAASSKYVGALLIPLCLIAPCILPDGTKAKYFKGLIVSGILALTTFLTINYPLLSDPALFLRGVDYEFHHAVQGHDYLAPIPISPFDFWFGFHFLYSLIPGIGFITALLGALYTFSVIFSWRKSSQDEKILSLFILLFYFAAELSPLKPFPDFMRYMIPVVPPLAIFACQACRFLFRGKRILPAIGLTSFLLAAAGYSAWNTISLVKNMSHDTRDISTLWMMEHEGEYLAERYTGKNQSNRYRTLADTNIEKAQAEGIKYLIISSFVYDRIVFAKTLPHHDPAIDAILNDYHRLLTYPYIEIKSDTPSYAFTNPTIKIIDITKSH